MTVLALVAALLVVAGGPGADVAPPPGAERALDLSPRPEPHRGGGGCASCHTTAGWSGVTFAHERTGFALTGRHRELACQGCHAGGDLAAPLPRACQGCHRDVHGGRAGGRCGDCHGTLGWREETFGPEAHRRTDFPLTGRHALVPCEECHGERRDRAYARPTPRCVGCHELDFVARSAAAGVDHVAIGFGQDCRTCHGAWRFSAATYPAHAACFQIDAGPHARIRCRDCHVASLPSVPPGGALTCASDTADCLHCHTMPGIADRHAGVAGFEPANRRCYECHRFSGATR